MPSSHYLVPRAKRSSFDDAETMPDVFFRDEWPWYHWGWSKFDCDPDDFSGQESNCGLLGWMQRDEIVGVYNAEIFICVDDKGWRYLRDESSGFVELPDDFSADSDTNSCTHEK